MLFRVDPISAQTTLHHDCRNCRSHALWSTFLSIIPWLVKDMISVSSDTLSLEDGREVQILRHLILRDDIIRAFRLSNDKFADLGVYVSIACSTNLLVINQNLTWSSVSVMVEREMRAYPARRMPLYRMYSHHLSQSLGSISRMPLRGLTQPL
jgi:hypothetical protein